MREDTTGEMQLKQRRWQIKKWRKIEGKGAMKEERCDGVV